VTHNTTGAVQSPQSFTALPDLLVLQPGPLGDLAVVRWTAPTARTIEVDGRFQRLDRVAITGRSDVSVVLLQGTGSVSLLADQDLVGFGARIPFAFSRQVAAGDILEFRVGASTDTSAFDATGLSVIINPVLGTVVTSSIQGDATAVTGSADTNPISAWTYGVRTNAASSFVRFGALSTPYGASLPLWSNSNGPPYVMHNPTASTQVFSSISVPPTLLNLHPGPNGERTTVRWTAPASNTVSIKGFFQGIDTGQTSSDVAISYNGAVIFPPGQASKPLNGFGTQVPFSLIRAVNVGDVVEFSVGFGSNQTYNSDSTGLAATITPVSTGFAARTFPTNPANTSNYVDFSAIPGGLEPGASNPAGAWTFGQRATAAAAFVPYSSRSNVYGPSLLTWNGGGGCCPHATVNLGSATQTFSSLSVPPGFVALHPGPNGERSIARWTAPLTGSVQLDGSFQGIDMTSSDVTLTLYHGSSATVLLGPTQLNGRGTSVPFSQLISLNSGDTIEASVGYGSNATYYSDGTGFSATISYPAQVGLWAPPMAWPLVALHMSVLPSGKVLLWTRRMGYNDDTSPTASKQVRLWDPASPSTVTLVASPANAPQRGDGENAPNSRNNDIFCSGHAFLPDGRLLISGGLDYLPKGPLGHRHANLFDPSVIATNPWTSLADQNGPRWYPTATPLSNGEVLVMPADKDVDAPAENWTPQVWQTNAGGGWRTLSNAPSPLEKSDAIYNWLYATSSCPSGLNPPLTPPCVFSAGPDHKSYYLSTAGTGAWSSAIATNGAGYRDYGSSVMYGDGRILIVGGGGGGLNNSAAGTTNTAEVIDLANPVWNWTGAMSNARRHVTATLLPDGTVLATGGTSGPNYDTQAPIFAAEIWDPTTGVWSTTASMQMPRLYHSSAVLLPDARVLVAGGGAGGGPNVPEQFNAELFSPPYLFKGARPVIVSAPSTVTAGAPFTVTKSSTSQVSRVTLVRLSSTTHGFNANQRISELTVTPSGNTLTMTAPSTNTALPGHYMLFLLDQNGVPSVASIIRLQ